MTSSVTLFIKAPGGTLVETPQNAEAAERSKRITQLFKQKVVPEGIETEKFTVNLDAGQITYFEKQTGKEVIIDLWDLDSQEIDPLIKEAEECFPSSHHNPYILTKDSKGNTKGTKPLILNSEYLRKLPTTFDDCSKKYIPQALSHLSRPEQLVVMKRLLFAEVLHKKLSDGLENLIKTKKQLHSNASDEKRENWKEKFMN